MISLRRSFIGTTGLQFFCTGLSVISGIIYARYLGPEQYGLYGYIMSIIGVALLPVIAGLPTLLIREIASYQLDKKWGLLRGLFNWSLLYVIITSAFSISIIYIVILHGGFGVEIASLLWIALLLIPLKGLLSQQSACLTGFKKPILALFPGQLLPPSITLLFILTFVFINEELSVYKLIEFAVYSSVIAFLFSSYLLYRAFNKKTKVEKLEYRVKTWLYTLLPFSLMMFIGTLNSELATIVLGWFNDYESVAYFKVALQAVALVSLGLNSINGVIMPHIAQSYREGDMIKTQKLVTKSVRVSSTIALPILLALIFFGDVLIEMLFGSDFVKSYPLIIILSIGQLVNVLMGSVGVILNMTGNERASLKALVISFIINVIFMIILIPMYGAIGAAISVSIGLIIWNVLMSIDVYRLMGICSFFK